MKILSNIFIQHQQIKYLSQFAATQLLNVYGACTMLFCTIYTTLVYFKHIDGSSKVCACW